MTIQQNRNGTEYLKKSLILELLDFAPFYSTIGKPPSFKIYFSTYKRVVIFIFSISKDKKTSSNYFQLFYNNVKLKKKISLIIIIFKNN